MLVALNEERNISQVDPFKIVVNMTACPQLFRFSGKYTKTYHLSILHFTVYIFITDMMTFECLNSRK